MKTAKRFSRRRSPPGTAPGTLTANPGAQPTRLRSILFSADAVEEVDGIAPRRPGHVLWLNLDGLGDTALLKSLGETFGLHPLSLEDVLDTNQRQKAEEYDNHQFIVLRMPDRNGAPCATEHLAIFLGDGFVITMQERPGDVFDPVRTRLRNPQGQLRKRGADYLCYALIDAVIDSFFPELEKLGERLETMEDAVAFEADTVDMGEIHLLKRDLMTMRSVVWPLRDLVATLQREETPRFSEGTRVYLRDCQDHAVQLIEMVQTYREIANGLVEILLSSQANRTNEVMQVLTLIATIFIPLTFIAGVYGMNFADMPELHWRWGYPVVMAVMGVIAVLLTAWFWRRGWLRRR